MSCDRSEAPVGSRNWVPGQLLADRTVSCPTEVFALADVARAWTAAAATDRRVVLVA